MASGYKIGSTLETLTAIEEVLTDTDPDGIYPFPFKFRSYAEIVGKDLTGAPIKAGLPFAGWHFEWMSRTDYATLKAFEGVCYLTTNEGDDTFADYQAVMAIPEEPEAVEGHRVGPVDVEFWSLEAQS